jgi:hypothetical protein
MEQELRPHRTEMVDLAFRKTASVPSGSMLKRSFESLHEGLKGEGVHEFVRFVERNYEPGERGHEVKAHDLLKAYVQALASGVMPEEPAFKWLEAHSK